MDCNERVLVGTFIKKIYVPHRILKTIVEIFGANKIFIFDVADDASKRLITFNVHQKDLDKKYIEYKKDNKNTVRLHRRKDTNTFYTINSLNKIITEQNNGQLNSSFEVDWTEFENSCLVLDQEGNLKNLKTKLVKVIDYPTR